MRNQQSQITRCERESSRSRALGFANQGQPNRKALLAIVASVSMLLAQAGPASAGSVGIQFDISQSWISVLGGALVLPPDGVLSTDVMRVNVQANSATDIQSGGAFVRDIGIDVLSIDKNILGAAHVTGSLAVDQIGDAQANLVLSGDNGTLSLPFLLASSGLNLEIAPNVQCAGGACSLIASFPLTNVVLPPPLTGTLTIANIKLNGLASFQQTFAVTVSGLTGVVKLVGHEIERTFIPEPSSAALIWLGVVAATTLGRRATRVRSSHV